ncbi:carboxylesterase family protein [Actinomycetospora chlora]|uniref:Carboxylic ester hydrolase n=1 Tax=Actinomycetospora chlora TaxID=663608 RepID=A0ABP9AKU9_9PSEU
MRGTLESGVAVFRGIPFAAPPVGGRRFAAPARPAPWDGVRDALAFGPAPPQAAAFGMPELAGGEDWLTLNVWSPDPGRDAGLPVMVWIQGGGYAVGASGLPEYDGTRLARGGVVVVTANHRVGIEGFALLDGAPANRGLLDQVAVLEWVRDDVRAFGGDPGCVTVFGQSAGGGSVAALMAMPRAAGLVRRAVAQSVPGTVFGPELARDVAATCAAELGLAPTVEDLAEVDPLLLPLAADGVDPSAHADRWGLAGHRGVLFAPVVDGDVLPVSPWQARLDVDLLCGHTRDEHRLFSAIAPPTDEQITSAEALFAPRPYPPTDPAARYEWILSDWLFRMPSLHLAERATPHARVHVYELTFGGPLGACHGIDVPLVFGNLTAGQPAALLDDLDAAETVSARMRAAWVGFATRGDPGWPTFDTGDVALLDVDTSVAPYPETVSRELWRDHVFAPLPLVGR